ncbi:GNAT family N-acetyltransferase [Bacillus thuringiensis]
MDYKIISTQEEFYNIKKEWELMELKDSTISYYSTFQFNYTWWETNKVNTNLKLFIVCVYHNNSLVGIAPLMLERMKKKIFHYWKLSFLGRGDSLNFIINREQGNEGKILKEIFSGIEQNSSLWDKLELTHISEETVLFWHLMKNGKYNKYTQFLVQNPNVKLQEFESFDEFKKNNVPAKTNKFVNKLKKEVGYTFEVINNKYDRNIFKEIVEIHQLEQEFLNQEKGRAERESLFDDPKKKEFLHQLFESNENVLTFVLYSNEGDIITYNTCYKFHDKLHFWNTGYHPKYVNYNLSKVRMYEIINYLFDNKLQYTIDWGAGGYPWKFEWTNTYLTTYSLSMWNPNNKKAQYINKIAKIKKKLT